MKESRIISKLKAEVTRLGGVAVKLHGGPYQEAGLPDLVAVLDGETYWLEAKTETGSASPIQERQHERLRAAGANVHVVRSVGEVRKILQESS